MTARLPIGYRARLRSDLMRLDHGRLLAGGSPWRLVRLSRRAMTMLVDDEVTVTDAASASLVQRLLDLGVADPLLDSLEVPPGGLTVVVPVRDRAEALARLLASIRRQEPGTDVIVVDDASLEPESVERVAREYEVRLIRLPVNLGPAAARNRGLQEVRTAFVAFVDSDVVLENALTGLLRHFQDPLVAAVAPRVSGLDDRPSGWLARYENRRSALDMGPLPAVVRPRSRPSYVPGACLVARVEALGAGFEPDLRVAEDVDLVWRLAKSGSRVRYEPTVVVQHDHRTGLVGWFGRRFYYGTGAALLHRRHGGDVAPAVLSPAGAAFLLGLLLQRRWSLGLSMAALGVTAVRVTTELPGDVPRPAVAARLTGSAAVGWVMQLRTLLLRHWWPASVLLSPVSIRIRRAVFAALVLDTTWDVWSHVGRREAIIHGRSAAPYFVARRLDDVAYGAGLWWGALKERSVGALLPDLGRRSGDQ